MNPPRQSSSSLLFFALLLTTLISLVSAQTTFQGCYAIDDTLTLTNTSVFQSTGLCSNKICGPDNFAVYGLTGNQCYCGNSIPKVQVDGDKCNTKCPGWQPDTCGAVGYLSVWLTGVGSLVGNAATAILSTTPSATQTTSAASSTVYVTASQTTIIQAPTAESQTTSTPSGGGVSGGMAAGIAIGVLALVALAGVGFFFVRRRRRAEYQKQYEPSGFGSSPGSLHRPFGTDQRLEPQMLQKRESVGSLADENDYSRKILRVTNPDGS